MQFLLLLLLIFSQNNNENFHFDLNKLLPIISQITGKDLSLFSNLNLQNLNLQNLLNNPAERTQILSLFSNFFPPTETEKEKGETFDKIPPLQPISNIADKSVCNALSNYFSKN